MNRFSGGRDSKPRGRGNGRPSGFRAPPPSATGLEARFLQDTIRAGARVALSLDDGQTVRGVLKEFDRDQVTIERDSGRIVIRKSSIRYIAEE